MKKILWLFIASLYFASSFALVTDSFNNALPAFADSSGSYALIAGGSKGIGYAIAEALAKRHYNLVLIARHADSLLAAKNHFESAYSIHVEIIAKDLVSDKAAEEIAQWFNERNIHLKVLCNVAGFGGARDYLSLPVDSV